MAARARRFVIDILRLRVAVGFVRSVDAESLKYCDGSWIGALAGDIFSIFQRYPSIYLLHDSHPFLVVIDRMTITYLENRHK